jgi:DNA replication protein DnaC
MANRLKFANLPDGLKDVRLNSFTISAYKDDKSRQTIRNSCNAIKYWLDNFDNMKERGMGLYLFSLAKGSGKTRMAASIANELINEKKVMVKFATSMQIIDEIKSSWNKEHGVSESKLLDQLVTTEVLVIDDFGTERATDWTGEKFYSIINGRYADKKITIFTSNMSLTDLKYDDRITNRIKERNYLIPFPEESVRDHIAEKNRTEILGI